MTELIITEKPSQSLKIAQALSNKIEKRSLKKVPYYELNYKNKKVIIGCAVGHLFNLKEKNKNGFNYPVFDLEWVESSELNKESKFIKKYIDVLKNLAKQVDEYTVACDYDLEGSLIGYNCIRFICKKNDANRMKFSTLTKNELIYSYENLNVEIYFHKN